MQWKSLIAYQILPSFQTQLWIWPVSISSSGNHAPKGKEAEPQLQLQLQLQVILSPVLVVGSERGLWSNSGRSESKVCLYAAGKVALCSRESFWTSLTPCPSLPLWRKHVVPIVNKTSKKHKGNTLVIIKDRANERNKSWFNYVI